MPLRVCRFVADEWLRCVERRIERAVLWRDHADVLADYRRASRG